MTNINTVLYFVLKPCYRFKISFKHLYQFPFFVFDCEENKIDAKPSSITTSKTARTIQHGARFSRKLQKRLTRRTIAEVQALKNQGVQCVHMIMDVMKLV